MPDTPTPGTPPERPSPGIPPLVDWMSRHGLKLLGVLILLELGFHAFAVLSARDRDAENREPPIPATPPGDSVGVPA